MTNLQRLRICLGRVLNIPAEGISENAHVMDEIGADSLQFLEYICVIEKEFGIKLKGSDSENFSNLSIASSFLEQIAPSSNQGPVGEDEPATSALKDDFDKDRLASLERVERVERVERLGLDEIGNLHSKLEIGMPLTGRNNLGETPLLKTIGDLRWKHVELFSGLPSKELCDDTGERLYATFFYVEINFEKVGSMASFGENDHLHIVSTIQSSGGGVLDGFHWLLDDSNDGLEVPKNPAELAAAYVRTSNIFVKMLDGAQWLKRSKPCQAGMDLVPSAENPPDSAEFCRLADRNDAFEEVPEGWLKLCEKPVEVFYDIIPDRDLNGAGLLYFANYPQILDVCERIILQDRLPINFEEEIVDRRSTVRRQSAYLSNANQSDRISVSATVATQNPYSLATETYGVAEEKPIHLWINYVMKRCSDERKMMVCTVRKTFSAKTWGDTLALDEIRKLSEKALSVSPEAAQL